MKPIILRASLLTFLFLMLLILPIALKTTDAQTSDTLPTLRGDEAIEQLKQTGQYDSLMQAVRQIQKANGQTEDNELDAVGQSAKLTALDGAANDNFGWSVTVSGDTAIVGVPTDDVGANTNQGSAYAFVRNGTTWTQQQKLIASDGAAGDQFGVSVAINGNTAIVSAVTDDIVGQIGNQGSAYVFVRSGTTWSEQQKLTASDAATDDAFGASVSISGDTITVGANWDDIGGNINQGSAYIFVRSGTTWSEQQKLTASDGAADDHFGISVAISGDTIIVGAYFDDIGISFSRGSAHIFVKSGVTWSVQQILTASDGVGGDLFGCSVAINDDTAIIGARQDAVGGNTNQGSAYVFIRSGTTWSEQQKLTASDGAANDSFGISVAISGNTTIVGTWGDAVGSNVGQGSAYVFIRSGTIWNGQQKLTASDGAANDNFGATVAIGGGTVIVGAISDDVGANSNQGSAYIFRVLSNNWTQEARKVASDGAADDRFGVSVAISGETAIIGAYRDDISANNDQGSAYVFVRSGTMWIEQQKLTASDGAASDWFGYSVSISGDTIIVGAYSDDISANGSQGSAYVFTRSGTMWTEQQKLTALDGAAGDLFGVSVAIDGNTAIVGSSLDDIGVNSNQGSAYIFTRSGMTWSQQQKLTAVDGSGFDDFGGSVAISGNTVIVGADLDDVGANGEQGSAYVFVRSGTTWSQQQQLTAADGAPSDRFGYSVSISGNTAIVGARSDVVGASVNQGSAYVFVRSGTTWTEQQKLTASDGAAGEQFGISVAISGETVIVGAYGDNIGANPGQGSAYIFARSGTTWTQQQKLTASDGAASDEFGISVSISGDKIIVGADLSDASTSSPLVGGEFVPTATDQGAVYMFVNQPAPPTAANACINGRVITMNGMPIKDAIVSLTGGMLTTPRISRTNGFGYFTFEDLEVGQFYIASVSSKRYGFAQNIQAFTLIDNLDDIVFQASWEN